MRNASARENHPTREKATRGGEREKFFFLPAAQVSKDAKSIFPQRFHWCRRCRIVRPPIGSLSNNDDDGSQNITRKMNLRRFKLYRAYLEPLNSSNLGAFFRRMSTSSTKRRTGRFHVVVMQYTSKKCTKKRDARVDLLFCS